MAMRISVLFLCGLLSTTACQDDPAPVPPIAETTDRTDTQPAQDTGSTDTEPEPEPEPEAEPIVTEETVPDQELDDIWIFSRQTIHQIELTLPQASVDGLFADPYVYVTADVTFDGEAVDNVGVRLRGKIGSFRDLNGKPKFKIDFNQFVEDQRFWGLETISLNNEVVDYSYLKEPLAYALFEAVGVPASRTGFAEVQVNGQPYGLYVIIEVPDDRFLLRTYDDPTGNLYDGKYVWYGGYDYTLLDFGKGVDELYQLEEGTDVGNTDIIQISETLLASWGQPSFYSDMSEVLDWDEFLRELAVEQWIGQNDGYCLNTNNYRVYFNPSTGLAEIVPWDFDYSFLYDWQWGMDWHSPRGRLCYACVIDPECKDAWQRAVKDVLKAADDLNMVTMFDEMKALIEEAALNDPRREGSWNSVLAEQEEVRLWLQQRGHEIEVEWAL
jgi:hypothetical protein